MVQTTPNCVTSFDDVYIATGVNAQARVEIGNAATYAGSTQLTILTPTAWAATEITATVNEGNFDAFDSAYMYVTDSAGVVSDGFPITFESTQTIATTGTGTAATTGTGTPAVVGIVRGAVAMTIGGAELTIGGETLYLEGIIQ